MSDRAATEKKFNKLLKEYRSEILPTVYSNWDSLSVTKGNLSRMNNFYYGLHILVNFAEVADTVVKIFEDSKKEGTSLGAEAHGLALNTGESGAVRLVRTACKCLARGGDEKSGCYVHFKAYLSDAAPDDQKNKRSKLLVPFRGNRFNILFYNAEIVFFLHEQIKNFFTTVTSPENKLQKAVMWDIQEPLYLAILKALGLCSKVVTAPFWRILEQDCSLEDANAAYQRLHDFLQTAMDDCTDVLNGESSPFPQHVKKDDVYTRLMKADDFDSETCTILQIIFQSWHSLLIKAFGDHLSGGCFSVVDETLNMETISVCKHNKFPERVFALLDALTRFRPVATTLCNEAYIMFSLNKTGEWLASLCPEKRKAFLDTSRKEGKEIRAKYKRRLDEIEHLRRQNLKTKQEAKLKKEQEQMAQREQLINRILFYGLWQYPETVDEALKNISTVKEKRTALKTQLSFRKVILSQKANNKVFQFSETGKPLSVETMTDNVKMLITMSLQVQNEECTSLDPIATKFVGKRITHFQLSENIRTPYTGRVVSVVPGYPKWFNVVYDGDTAVYVYKLEEDFKAGDIEFVEGSMNVS